MYQNEFKMHIPPTEIWLDVHEAMYGLDDRAKLEAVEKECRFEYPEEGGILYYAPGTLYPYKGVSYPPATDNVAIFKRMILYKLGRYKNPFRLFVYKKDIRELEVLADVALHRYRLKPNLYAQAVREVYRLVLLITKSESWAHRIAMILQWDSAYRWRLQYAMNFFNKEKILKNLRGEINRLLDIIMGLENEPSIHKWNKAKWLVNLLLSLPYFRGIIRKMAEEIRLKEMVMDDNDIAYAFKK